MHRTRPSDTQIFTQGTEFRHVQACKPMHTLQKIYCPEILPLLQIYSLKSEIFLFWDRPGRCWWGKRKACVFHISPAHPGSSHPTKEERDNGRGDKCKSPRLRTRNASPSKALEPVQRSGSFGRLITTMSGPPSSGRTNPQVDWPLSRQAPSHLQSVQGDDSQGGDQDSLCIVHTVCPQMGFCTGISWVSLHSFWSYQKFH